MRAAAVIALSLTACGRLHFDPTSPVSDSATSDTGPDAAVDTRCNTAFDLGPIALAPGFNGETWIATASTPDGVLLAYTTPTQVALRFIALPAATLGPELLTTSSDDGNMQIAASGDRFLLSADSGTGTRLSLFDSQLNLITTRVDSLRATAPDHSTAANVHDFMIADSVGNTDGVRFVDGDTAATGSPTTSSDPNTNGGTAAQFQGGFAAGWWDNGNGCTIHTYDAALRPGPSTVFGACLYPRLAPMGGVIGIGYTDAAGTSPYGLVYDPVAASMTPQRKLASAIVEPPRAAASADGFWTLIDRDATTLVAVLVDASGNVGMTITLGPFAGGNNQFAYDVVPRGSSAYATWASTRPGAHVFIERLCP